MYIANVHSKRTRLVENPATYHWCTICVCVFKRWYRETFNLHWKRIDTCSVVWESSKCLRNTRDLTRRGVRKVCNVIILACLNWILFKSDSLIIPLYRSGYLGSKSRSCHRKFGVYNIQCVISLRNGIFSLGDSWVSEISYVIFHCIFIQILWKRYISCWFDLGFAGSWDVLRHFFEQTTFEGCLEFWFCVTLKVFYGTFLYLCHYFLSCT